MQYTCCVSYWVICRPLAVSILEMVGSKSTLSCDVPEAAAEAAPFSAAIPLSGELGSYILVRTGFAAGGAAGGGAGAIA
tara:strand:- start:74 stop:310 length:237 start_codon:yes stop_codon:yes gene_type:complete